MDKLLLHMSEKNKFQLSLYSIMIVLQMFWDKIWLLSIWFALAIIDESVYATETLLCYYPQCLHKLVLG